MISLALHNTSVKQWEKWKCGPPLWTGSICLNGPVLWTLIVDPWKIIFCSNFFNKNFFGPKFFVVIFLPKFFFKKFFCTNFFHKIFSTNFSLPIILLPKNCFDQIVVLLNFIDWFWKILIICSFLYCESADLYSLLLK